MRSNNNSILYKSTIKTRNLSPLQSEMKIQNRNCNNVRETLHYIVAQSDAELCLIPLRN